MRKSIFFFTCVIALLGISSGEALAHAVPLTYIPDASAVLEALPEQVEIQFSEHLEPSASSMKVFAPDGTRADSVLAEVTENDTRVLRVPLKNSVESSGKGNYAVSWQVVSADDGHWSSGSYSFSVGTTTVAGALPSIDVKHNSGLIEAAVLLFEHFGESVFLSALILFMFLLRPVHKRLGMALGKEYPFFERRFTFAVSSAFLLIILGSIAFLGLKVTELADLQSLSLLSAVHSFAQTVSGEFALARIAIAFLALAVFLPRWRKILVSPKITKSEIILLILALILAALHARLSHAAASPFLPHFSILVNFFHMLGKGFFVGAPVVIAIVFAPALKRCSLPLSTATILSWYSRFAAVAIGLGGVTGAYIVWLHLKGWGNLFTTDWGERFLYLLTAALVLFVIRMYHQFLANSHFTAPLRHSRENGNPEHGSETLDPRIREDDTCRRYRFGLEALAGVVVSFFSAWIIITTPPFSAGPFEMVFENNSATITLSEYQDMNMSGMMGGMMMGQSHEKYFLISVKNSDGTPTKIKNFSISLANPTLGIDALPAEGHAMGSEQGNEFMFSTKQLSPAGEWEINVTAERENAYDAVAEFHLNYPSDFLAPKHERKFGAFEAELLFIALGIIALAVFLYKKS